MKKTALPIVIIFFAAFLGFGFSSGRLQEKLPESVLHYNRQWTWVEKIEEGKELLRNSPKLTYTYEKKRGKKKLVDRQIAFAVLDTQTGEVFEKRIWVSQQHIDQVNSKAFEGVLSVMDESFNPYYKMEITNDWWNSFNSPYSIEPDNYVVVANKYPLLSELIPNPAERSPDDYTDIIYVPYSKYIHQEELIKIGKIYLNIVDEAFEELDRAGVKSKDGVHLVTDSVSKEFIKQIIVTEHMDPDLLAIAVDSGRALTERVYIIIGANREKAFYYTSSSADARGIAQFIQRTYNSMASGYPAANLIRNYRLGASDHKNVIKAMVLLFADNEYYLADELTKIAPEDRPIALAAAYNGNPLWVKLSIQQYGANWLKNQERRRILRAETFGYIEKLRALMTMDIWE